MRTTPACLVLLALLGGCAGRAATPAVPDQPEAAACREEWSGNPERRRLLQQRADSNQFQIDARIEEARQAAYRDCLRRRGIIEGGGVERVRR